MKEITETEEFLDYINGLRDVGAVTKITERIRRLRIGNAGDYKHLGGGLIELRIKQGKGYRVYYAENDEIILIVYMGHKGTQPRDIKKARRIAEKGTRKCMLNQGLLIPRTI
ncbi:MAG: type II toxin-antitoxin system RelE/ParE family toxin [Candidatus Halichondribacter symbioticus]